MKKPLAEHPQTAATEACDEQCPVRTAVNALDGKWTLLVLRDLMSGKKRYSELERSLAGISPRLLTARLRELEQRKLVKRQVYPTQPPSTEYSLTALGETVRPLIAELARFGSSLMSKN